MSLQTRRVSHNDKGVNTSGSYNNYTYICTSNRTEKNIKQKLTEIKGEINEYTIITGILNTSVLVIDITSREIKSVR